MKRPDALGYVSWILDDFSLNAHTDGGLLKPDAVLVGYQCGFEPMFVAVQSYLPGVVLSADEAVELAIDWLEEKNWFSGRDTEPDYVIGSK